MTDLVTNPSPSRIHKNEYLLFKNNRIRKRDKFLEPSHLPLCGRHKCMVPSPKAFLSSLNRGVFRIYSILSN